MAPMVEASELPWRLLSRRHSAHLAYSPMLHSGHFATSLKYRQKEFTTCPEDRPLFVQVWCPSDEPFLSMAFHLNLLSPTFFSSVEMIPRQSFRLPSMWRTSAMRWT